VPTGRKQAARVPIKDIERVDRLDLNARASGIVVGATVASIGAAVVLARWLARSAFDSRD
jgi:hypothetical protein